MTSALDANPKWNFEGQESKLLALGVHNQDTSDLDSIVASRHQRKPEIMSRLQLQKGDVVMDLGSGMGFIAEVIAPEVAKIHCCDISSQFLQDCKERTASLGNLEFHQISYADLSSAYGKNVNKAYSTLLFIHFNFYDILFYLQEMHKVLADGGLFYFDFNDGERFNIENKSDSFHEHIAIYKENRENWIFGCMHMTSAHLLYNLAPQLGFRIVGHWTTDIAFSQMLLQKVSVAERAHPQATPAIEGTTTLSPAGMNLHENWDYTDPAEKFYQLGTKGIHDFDLGVIAQNRYERAERIARLLEIGAQDIVLDLGSGMGFMAERLAPRALWMHCADVSPTYMEDCRKRLAGRENVQTHLIPYGDLSSLDGKGVSKIYSTLLFIHFNFYDLTYYLREAHRILNPGGLFLFDYNDGDVFRYDNPSDSFNSHIDSYRSRRPEWTFGCMQMTSTTTLRTVLPQLGFEIVAIYPSSSAFTEMVVRKAR